MNDPADIIENRDSIEHLERNGFAELIEVLDDPSCYTSGGRLIQAEIARRLKINPKRVAEMLATMRELLT